MRITELFNIQSIALDSAAADQAQIIDELVELQATHGNLTDKAAYKAAIYAREAEASTYVDNGITVPHARAACVTRPSLAALRLKTPVQYNADDDGKTDLLFMIAAPENGSLHIDIHSGGHQSHWFQPCRECQASERPCSVLRRPCRCGQCRWGRR